MLGNFKSGVWPYFIFVSNKHLHVVLDGEFSQKCPVSTGFLQGSILGPTLFFSLLYINDLSDDICNIAIYVDDTKFYSKCDQASDL